MGATIGPDSDLVIKIPEKPDPFWPAGAVPTHLPKDKLNDSSIVATFTEVTGPVWHCTKCNGVIDRSTVSPNYCTHCVEAESQNSALAKKTNSNWMDEAKELGLELFERQPEETDTEWLIWCKYRECYPMKLPTWNELSKKSGAAVLTVVKAASKWSYKVRLVAWARFTDAGMQEKRIEAIKEMNNKHLSMAQDIQDKLAKAITAIIPETLRPGEIVNLFKIATELERKVVMYSEEKVDNELTTGKNKQVSLTKPEDLAEVVAILQKTGLLDGKTLGIEQTTRIVAREEE